jgi:5-methylcytosine-specific restriction protein A
MAGLSSAYLYTTEKTGRWRMKARKPCNVDGCPDLAVPGRGRCEGHEAQADRARGTSHSRGYGARHRRFRRRVLKRDPVCVLCEQRVATVADHHPHSLQSLTEQGLDPYDPSRGRGLCAPCHGRETARLQPGGFNATGADTEETE